jgi:hypothetical protein
MASALLFRQVRVLICLIVQADLFQRVAPAAAGALVVGITLFPKTSLHAEAPEGLEVRLLAFRTFK